MSSVARAAVATIMLCGCAIGTDGVSARDTKEIEAGADTHGSYRLELTGWQDETMCRALDAAIQKRWTPKNGRLCSIPITKAGPEFSLPEWRDTDGVALLDEIRELALLKDWFVALKPVTAKWERKQIPRKAPDELIEEIWTPMEGDFLSKLESGDLGVQEATFDFNNDGEVDTIYRIRNWTLVETGRPGKPFEPKFWEPVTCEPGGIDASFIFFKKRTKDYGYHDLADLLLSFAWRSRDIGYYVFQYEGQTFQHWSFLTGITEIPRNPQGAYCDWRRTILE